MKPTLNEMIAVIAQALLDEGSDRPLKALQGQMSYFDMMSVLPNVVSVCGTDDVLKAVFKKQWHMSLPLCLPKGAPKAMMMAVAQQETHENLCEIVCSIIRLAETENVINVLSALHVVMGEVKSMNLMTALAASLTKESYLFIDERLRLLYDMSIKDVEEMFSEYKQRREQALIGHEKHLSLPPADPYEGVEDVVDLATFKRKKKGA